MLITSATPEYWKFMGRGIDRETGYETCDIKHVVNGRVGVHRLTLVPDRGSETSRWRHWATLSGSLPMAGWRRVPERRGKLLSNSRIDLTLLSFATTGHGALYA